MAANGKFAASALELAPFDRTKVDRACVCAAAAGLRHDQRWGAFMVLMGGLEVVVVVVVVVEMVVMEMVVVVAAAAAAAVPATEPLPDGTLVVGVHGMTYATYVRRARKCSLAGRGSKSFLS